MAKLSVNNNTYHKSMKIKPFDLMSSTNINFNIEYSVKDPKCKVVEHARISKYKIIFCKSLHSELV